jgi:hypothetical protein
MAQTKLRYDQLLLEETTSPIKIDETGSFHNPERFHTKSGIKYVYSPINFKIHPIVHSMTINGNKTKINKRLLKALYISKPHFQSSSYKAVPNHR